MKQRGISGVLAAAAALACVSGRVAAQDKTYEQLKTLVDVLDYVRQDYVDETDTQKLIYGAAAGMVRTLDPFSQFMDPEAHRDIKMETEGQFGGLGIRVMIQGEWPMVITPLPGTPAYRLGILPRDRIIEIDGESTRDMDITMALKKLRGKPGTKARLSILRFPEGGEDGASQTKEFTLTRENIKIESVQSWPLEEDVGYLRIIEFSANTAGDVAAALRSLKKEGAGALVLDLRNNPGGLLSSAVEVASNFLGDNKLIVYTQGRRPESRQEFHSGPTASYGSLPMVVLVNEGSASGAEIVAGALQDHRRALIIGMRTYGKASVQSVIPLPDGTGLRLTVARYYTPSGRSIQRDEKNHLGGIIPDIEVFVDEESEAKLYAQWDMVYALGKKPKSAVKKEEMIADEALARAVELLKARRALGALQGG